ncbi:phosphotransferase [Microbacterium sp. SORGH_AS_0888]|uniref:phosphotransferase n=1 Tax=Microbacterium sp. SORGH_AS_0888 TaxID=3041791 RepID=UPI0027891D0D|nr:phosphotransferase [Microbacterium sp. SORGH_AS_0888]MDQ1130692.1 thiamine kinase-like enzyme [Microbacterium sp. SORGH_AS_0888]
MTEISNVDIDDVRTILASSPFWSTADITVQHLSGGAAHRNFLVTAGDAKCVVKIWNNYWESVGVLPPADVVLANTATAAALGIGAPLIAVCAEPPGVALEFLLGKSPTLAADDDAVTKLIPALHQLHRSGTRFANDINPFEHARTLFAAARAQGFSLPAGISEVESAMAEIEEALDLHSEDFVPCHNDLWDANVITDPTGNYRLIDWDLAGNTDPSYEVGFLAAQNCFDLERTNQLIAEYFGSSDPQVHARVRLFMAVAHWSNTALWVTAQGNLRPADDFDYEAALQDSWNGLLRELLAPNFRTLLDTARHAPRRTHVAA